MPTFKVKMDAIFYASAEDCIEAASAEEVEEMALQEYEQFTWQSDEVPHRVVVITVEEEEE